MSTEPEILLPNVSDRRRISWVRIALATALAAILLGIAAMVCVPKPPEIVQASAGPEAVAVKTVAAELSDVPERVSYAARVEETTRVNVAAELAGRVVWLGADKGQAVTNGQRLLEVDSRTAAIHVTRTQAALKQAADDLRRLEAMGAEGAASESELDGARTQQVLAKAAADEAALVLEKCSMASPLDGIVLERNIEAGEFATPGVPVFTLVTVDPLDVVVELPERDIFAVTEGQEVPFRADALPDRTVTGRVSHLAGAADDRSNTYRMEITIPNADGRLRPGVLGKVEIDRRLLRQVVTIPLEAVIPEKGADIAYVVEGGRAVRRQVTLAAVLGRRAVVSAGIAAGESVVVVGQRLLADGVLVRVETGGAE